MSRGNYQGHTQGKEAERLGRSAGNIGVGAMTTARAMEKYRERRSLN